MIPGRRRLTRPSLQLRLCSLLLRSLRTHAQPRPSRLTSLARPPRTLRRVLQPPSPPTTRALGRVRPLRLHQGGPRARRGTVQALARTRTPTRPLRSHLLRLNCLVSLLGWPPLGGLRPHLRRLSGRLLPASLRLTCKDTSPFRLNIMAPFTSCIPARTASATMTRARSAPPSVFARSLLMRSPISLQLLARSSTKP